MTTFLKVISYALISCYGIAYAASTGGVTVGGTRLIYDGARKEASISVSNSDTSPYLIQSWVELNNSSPAKAPFIITPPLFRLNSNQQNTLRVVRTAGSVPEDRESLYWINIKSIPVGSKNTDANTLQIAVKTRIKLIYRPAGLTGIPEDLTSRLRWQLTGNTLKVSNPTPHIMNFKQVKVGGRKIPEITYVLPMSNAEFRIAPGLSGPITWSLISDYGGSGKEHTVNN